MATFLQSVRSLALCCCILATVSGIGCPFEECSCKKLQISCSGRGLKEIPTLLVNATYHDSLTFEVFGNNNCVLLLPNFASLSALSILCASPCGNSITKIPAGKLPPKLVSLIFSRNPITVIDAQAFNDSSNTLDSLTFSEAKFTKIPDAFLQLRVLKYLSIEDGSIQDWNDAAMKNIAPTLNTLMLVNVNLHTWPTWIQYCTNLNYLTLEDNFISSIPDDGLDMLANTLTTLDLTRNNLTAFPKTIQKLTALQNLYLDSNKIFYTTWLPLSSSMTILSLSDSHLVDAQDLSKSLRPYAQTLTDIFLDNNNFTEIPDLSYLTRIDSLDFTSNQISNTLVGTISSLVDSLFLDYNFLPTIPRVYANSPSLETIQMTYNLVREIRGVDIPLWITDIELSYNLIMELTDTSFPENSSVESLGLVSNPIVQISPNAFKNLQQLNSLNLQKTKLVRLPLALRALTKLTWLDLTGNVDLVCTCEEKSLGDWVKNQTFSIDEAALCGQVSISYFFQYLSPSCP